MGARVQRQLRAIERRTRMSHRFAAFALVFVLAACTSAPHPSTSPHFAVEGIISFDSTPLPGATILLAKDNDAFVRTTVTSVDGTYRFDNVPPGTYQLTAEMESFGRSTRQIRVGTSPVRQDIALHLTSVAESITVTAAAPAVLETTEVQASISTNDVPTARQLTGTVYIQDAVQEVAPRAQYATLPEHAFTATEKQSTTTFALDVDRASYTNIRRYLTASQLPPPEAVRVEEMINYFPYHYPAPASDRALSVTTEVAGCPWNPQHRLVRIGVQAKNIEEWKMAPNNLVFLLDISGSMQPADRLPLIQQAFRLLVERLRAEDSVAIVTYAGRDGLALPRTSGADKATILAAIDHLNSGGSTAGGAGIELAYRVAEEHFSKEANNRVILATDGDFNVGISDVDGLTKLIESKRDRGIFLTVLGVGSDPSDSRMEALADHGNGFYAYLDSMAEAKKVFVSELTGTLVTVAKDVKAQLSFDPSRVASYRQIGYENRALKNEEFADDKKDGGEVGSGHTVTALYEIEPAPRAMGGALGTLKIRYKEPSSSKSTEFESPIVDDGTSIYAASTDLRFAAAVAELGMLLRRSQHSGTATFDDAIALARASYDDDLDGYREELVKLAETSRRLSR
jgi:Ca-activated chloride channel family protein